MPSLIHNVSKSEAEGLLSGRPDGSFLFRSRKDSEYVLSVVFKGMPTHHLVNKDGDGNLLINKKKFCEAKTVDELAEGMSHKGIKGWPVPLTLPVYSNQNDANSSSKATTPAPSQPSLSKAQSTSSVAQNPPTDTNTNADADAPTSTPPPHSEDAGDETADIPVHTLTKDKAEDLLTGNNTGNGTYLFRRKGSDIVLSVIFSNRPSHHLVGKQEDTGFYTVNKKLCTGCTTLKQVVEFIQKPEKKWWPAQLTTRVAPEEEEKKNTAPPSPPPDTKVEDETKETTTTTPSNATIPETPETPETPTPTDAVAVSQTQHIGVHPFMNKANTTALLEAEGQDEGNFFIKHRKAEQSGTEFVLVTRYQGNCSQHLVTQQEHGGFVLNKKQLPDIQTLDDLVEHLRSRRPYWPLELTKYIAPKGTQTEKQQAHEDGINSDNELTPKAKTHAQTQALSIAEEAAARLQQQQTQKKEQDEKAASEARKQEKQERQREREEEERRTQQQHQEQEQERARIEAEKQRKRREEEERKRKKQEEEQMRVVRTNWQLNLPKGVSPKKQQEVQEERTNQLQLLKVVRYRQVPRNTALIRTHFAEVYHVPRQEDERRALLQRAVETVEEWERKDDGELWSSRYDDRSGQHQLQQALRAIASARRQDPPASVLMSPSLSSLPSITQLIAYDRDMAVLRTAYKQCLAADQVAQQREREMKERMASMLKPARFKKSQFLSTKRKPSEPQKTQPSTQQQETKQQLPPVDDTDASKNATTVGDAKDAENVDNASSAKATKKSDDDIALLPLAERLKRLQENANVEISTK